MRASANESGPLNGIVTSMMYASLVDLLRMVRSGFRREVSPGIACSLN